MKGIMPQVSEHFLQARRRIRADRWDEMWDGELHMPPAPNREHQDFETALRIWLELHWAIPTGGRVHQQVNLASAGGWPEKDYRIPDLVLMTPECFHIDHNEYFEGAPTVAVEIHSPGDEAYEKLSFYARLGVPEVWIIDRDSKEPELYLLETGDYRGQEADGDRWCRSPATAVQMRPTPEGTLEIERVGDSQSRRFLSDAQSAF
jgi:Uma2 family endonuclease